MKKGTVSVLCIDDEEMLREIVGDYLEDSGYKVYLAASGEEGLEIAKTKNPDVILADINMPGMSGLEMIEELKKFAPDIPVIVVSGAGQTEYIIQALRLGAWDYMTKPLGDMAFLEHSIEKAIKKMTLMQENKEYKDNLEATNKTLSDALEQLINTQNQLVESEKMAALGGLVAGVAHEINTPVGIGITGITHLLDETKKLNQLYQKDEMTQSEFEEFIKSALDLEGLIEANLTRAASLIKSFKQVAVDQTSEARRTFIFKDYIRELLLSLSRATQQAQLKIDVDCPFDLEIDSYPGLFSQIFTNLIMNSIQHGFGNQKGGQLSIQVTQEDNTLHIIYEDNGKGMNEEVQRKLFEPFFTTARDNGGTGLGMSILYNIITGKLRGSISCESNVGKGSRFIIDIPLDKEI